jgi:hypothetical protein
LEFPSLTNLNVFQGRAINRAELILPYEDDLNYSLPTSLFMKYKDEDDYYRDTPGGTTTGVLYDSFYQYRCDVSSYVQRLLNGSIETQGLFLFPDYGSTSLTRVVLHGPEYSSSNKQQNMRLLITFSK